MDHSTSLPSLDALQAVLAANRTGSFSGAASELGITHGAVSRRIGSVERWAGAPLFERHGRGVRVTIEGQRFAGLIEQALEMIGSGASQWRGDRDVEIVRVSVVPSFARLWLIPNLAALEGSPQDLRIDCEVDHRFAPLTQIDVAIRYGRGSWREGAAIPLFAETLIPVASPKLADSLGASPSVGEILRHPLIHDSYPEVWRIWLSEQGHNYRSRPQDRRFPDYDLVLQAATAGGGVALLREPYGNVFVENGSLVRLSSRTVLNPLRFYAITQVGPKRGLVQLLMHRLEALSNPKASSR